MVVSSQRFSRFAPFAPSREIMFFCFVYRLSGETGPVQKTVVTESTSNAMSDEKLVALVGSHFN